MKKIILVAALLAVSAIPGRAQWTVFDPANFAEAIDEFNQAVQIYNSAQSQLTQLTNLYTQATTMAKMLENMPQRYAATFSNWTSLTGAVGINTNWLSGVNSGCAGCTSTGYSTLSGTLTPLSQVLSGVTNPTRIANMTAYNGNILLADGSTQQAMNTIGTARANGSVIDSQLSNLQSDIMVSDPSVAGEIAQLQKVQAAGFMTARQTSDLEKIQTMQLQQQLIQAQRQRQQDGEIMLTESGLVQGPSASAGSVAGLSQAIANYSIPSPQ